MSEDRPGSMRLRSVQSLVVLICRSISSYSGRKLDSGLQRVDICYHVDGDGVVILFPVSAEKKIYEDQRKKHERRGHSTSSYAAHNFS